MRHLKTAGWIAAVSAGSLLVAVSVGIVWSWVSAALLDDGGFDWEEDDDE